MLITYAGDKSKQQKDDSERKAENQRRAGASYRTPEPEETDTNEEGLPWGSISMRHVITTGRTKEQIAKEQNAKKRTEDVAASKGGGSSK